MSDIAITYDIFLCFYLISIIWQHIVLWFQKKKYLHVHSVTGESAYLDYEYDTDLADGVIEEHLEFAAHIAQKKKLERQQVL